MSIMVQCACGARFRTGQTRSAPCPLCGNMVDVPKPPVEPSTTSGHPSVVRVLWWYVLHRPWVLLVVPLIAYGHVAGCYHTKRDHPDELDKNGMLAESELVVFYRSLEMWWHRDKPLTTTAPPVRDSKAKMSLHPDDQDPLGSIILGHILEAMSVRQYDADASRQKIEFVRGVLDESPRADRRAITERASAAMIQLTVDQLSLNIVSLGDLSQGKPSQFKRVTAPEDLVQFKSITELFEDQFRVFADDMTVANQQESEDMRRSSFRLALKLQRDALREVLDHRATVHEEIFGSRPNIRVDRSLLR